MNIWIGVTHDGELVLGKDTLYDLMYDDRLSHSDMIPSDEIDRYSAVKTPDKGWRICVTKDAERIYPGSKMKRFTAKMLLQKNDFDILDT